MQITSGKFEAELFSMANGTEFTDNASYTMPCVEHVHPDSNGEVILTNVPTASSLYIEGMTMVAYNATLASGQYKLKTNGASEKTLVFYMGDSTANPVVPPDVPTGVNVEVHYEYTQAVKEAMIDNRSSAIGEAILVWPVYASSDDCSVSSSIIGYVVMKVFRCRVTAAPGFDSSYKSANTLIRRVA